MTATTTGALPVAAARPAPAAVPLAVLGWGVVSSSGIGADAFAEAIVAGRSGLADVGDMFPEPLPDERACAMPGFNVKDHLKGKGTRHLDRATKLALVGTDLALADARPAIEDDPGMVGIVLGTTAGSVKTTSDYSRDTFVQDKPYLVDPIMFPSATINGSAGRCAIWHKLGGVNATIAGGQLSGLQVLRYGRMVLGRGHADALLAGAVEEFSPQMAWAARHLYGDGPERVPVGEAAVVFAVRDARRTREAGIRPDAEVLGMAFGTYAPPGEAPDPGLGLAECIGRALRQAEVEPGELWAVSTGERGVARLDQVERRGVQTALGGRAVRSLRVKSLVGECHSASGGLQLAALLAHHRHDPALDGRASLVTSVSADGAVGAAVVRGWSRPHSPQNGAEA
ncbi:3-oxoacyl-[acyl-carrier-protein] synthase II [Thermomonospora echinospora]|uniref:3-oxoacyl-[acyl-carrier-protein] synthase II n=1 Tax=Thermomonospora echinospora TaxID=1992 RepID=A0A1H5VIB1_9ACTN|nr:beta-ketoacyl synthase N-terminal-like domain-containing protein [Thermomonospora echinospora]SEF86247.1 3-oxoacyl-[acyl-carrier-protein] synthase II [Thermomonospora echinospora]